MKVPRRILFATDFSRASRAAWKEARNLASSPRCELLVAHVLQMPTPLSPDGFPLPRMADELAAAVRREAEVALGSLLKEARGSRLRATGLLLTGKPEKAIAPRRRNTGPTSSSSERAAGQGCRGCCSAASPRESSRKLRARSWPCRNGPRRGR
jgi:nucleotide-binding universal stress UspA family protein